MRRERWEGVVTGLEYLLQFELDPAGADTMGRLVRFLANGKGFPFSVQVTLDALRFVAQHPNIDLTLQLPPQKHSEATLRETFSVLERELSRLCESHV